VIYRSYKPEDFIALYAIEELCFQPPDRFSRRYMRHLIQQTNAATWIAEDGGEMCGFGIVEWTHEAAETVAYIQTLEVIPEGRGQGVGGELLRRLENSACAAGASVIWLHVEAGNAAAIGVYERQGYRVVGKEKDYYGRGRAALNYAKHVGGQQVML